MFLTAKLCHSSENWLIIPSLTQYTFRLELDKYVQGLHSSLQTPEVWQCGNEVRYICCHYIINAILICVRVSCRILTPRFVPIWAGGMRSLWCTFIGWCTWSRATSASSCMPWVMFHLYIKSNNCSPKKGLIGILEVMREKIIHTLRLFLMLYKSINRYCTDWHVL